MVVDTGNIDSSNSNITYNDTIDDIMTLIMDFYDDKMSVLYTPLLNCKLVVLCYLRLYICIHYTIPLLYIDVFDVYIDNNKRVWVVDINAYNSDIMVTDPLLFSYPELEDIYTRLERSSVSCVGVCIHSTSCTST